MAYNSKYTGAQVEELLDKASDVGLWNTYLFESRAEGDSIVVIDGEEVTIPAGTTLQGTFKDDISEIITFNLKRSVIRGDVTLPTFSLGLARTWECSVDIEFSPSFERSCDNLFSWLSAASLLRMKGGKPTSCYRMFYGANAKSLDLSGADFSACTSADYMFQGVNVGSLDLSGADFSACTSADYMFQGVNVKSLDLSGADFSALTSAATQWIEEVRVKSLNLSGIDFSAITCTRAPFALGSCSSVNLNGVTLPTDSSANARAVTDLIRNARYDNSLLGQFGTIQPTTLDLSNYERGRGTMTAIINALGEGAGEIIVNEYTYKRLASSDIEVATNLGWTITQA